MIGIMAISRATFSCYVRDCAAPMASVTTPLIGPCKNHTDTDVWATIEWMREQLDALRHNAHCSASAVADG